MFNLAKDIHSITNFKRNSGPILNRVIENKSPAVLTLNGSSSVVVVDVDSYQNLIEIANKIKILQSVEIGITQIKQGKLTPGEKVFANLKKMHTEKMKALRNASTI